MFHTIVDDMQYHYRVGILTKAQGCGASIGFKTEYNKLK